MAVGSSASCQACRFYEDHKSNGGASAADAGLCRFNPPVSQPDATARGLWPVVTSADWCGHFSSDRQAAE